MASVDAAKGNTMLIRNVLRLLLGVGATILLLSMGWTATPSHSSTKGLGTKLNGVRLVAPILDCAGSSCGSQQAGCENFSLRFCIPGCAVSATSSVRAQGGAAPYTFNVTDPNGNPVSTSPPIDLGGGYFEVTFTATRVGSYTAAVTDAKGCRVTCSEQAQAQLGVTLEVPPCQIPGTFRALVIGGTAAYAFNVTDIDGKQISTSTPSPGDFGLFVTFTGTKTGTYTVMVTDANGCQGKATAAVVPCSSLTQSEWGKNKPKFNGQKRAKTIRKLFASSFATSGSGDLIVGVPRSGLRSVTFLDDAASCIIDRLPASGSPTSLPVGLGDVRVNLDTCQTSPQLPLVADKFQNELLGQTIALTLNAGGALDSGGLSPDFYVGFPSFQHIMGLWSVIICNAMVTQSALPGGDGILGTEDDLLDPGPDGVLGTLDDPKLAVTIPTAVLNAIASASALELLGKFTVGPQTVPAGSVGRLLILANLALAGETNLGGASLDDINSAVDAINRAFDKGRFLIDCACSSCAHLQINFNPNPVPKSAQPCGGSSPPSWFCNATIMETAGIGINISRFTWDFYDSAGNLFSTQTNSSNDFPAFFNQCGAGSTRIPANGRVCGSWCISFFGALNSGSVIMTFYGTDDNGNQVSFRSSPLMFLGQ